MGEWKEVTIDQIKANSPNALATGPFGSAISSKFFTDNGVPVIRGGNLSADISNRLSETGLVFISTSKAEEFKRSEVRKGDLVFTCWGTINQIGLIDGKGSYPVYIISNKQMKLTPHPKKADPFFLYYFFSSPQMQEQILSSNIGSSVPGFNLGQLKAIELNLPPLPEQKGIASVLSSLDDKIDLLHRQNKTLEAMAETIFRQWFVEEAQEDWEEGRLGDVIELVYGKGLKKEIRTGIGYPVIGSSGVVGYHSEYLVEGPGIVIGRKGTLGKVIYLWDNFFPIDTTYYIKSKVESAGLLYEYFLLKTLNFEEMNSDSAVPGLNRDIALSAEIKIVPLDKLQKFNQFSSTFTDKLRENEKQINTLEKLRDSLLPKLMSGEVKVYA